MVQKGGKVGGVWNEERRLSGVVDTSCMLDYSIIDINGKAWVPS